MLCRKFELIPIKIKLLHISLYLVLCFMGNPGLTSNVLVRRLEQTKSTSEGEPRNVPYCGKFWRKLNLANLAF